MSVADKPQNVLSVQMLGGFCVKYGDMIISDNSPRAQNVWTLFKYLLINKGRAVPVDTLINLLWPEECYNPVKALQNLVYRLRNILATCDESLKDEYILYMHGAYMWNDNIAVDFDCCIFEKLCTDIRTNPGDSESTTSKCEQALALYSGNFLGDSLVDEWVFPQVNYYRRLFYQTIIIYIDLLEKAERHEDIIKCCEKIIQIDIYEEEYHVLLIRSLLKLGRVSQAVNHYEYISSMLLKEFGVEPSDKLKSIESEIYKDKNTAQYDINTVFEFLSENAKIIGAFYCNLDVFKELFRLEMRSSARYGVAVYLVLFTFTTERYTIPEANILKNIMTALKKACIITLRKGDVVSQFNKSQMLALLSSTTYANIQMVTDRVIRRFHTEYKGSPVLLTAKIKALALDKDGMPSLSTIDNR